MKKEKIYNVPNAITSLRIIISIFIISTIFFNVRLQTIIIAFVIGAITDFADGYMARKLKQETEFGRKFDMVSDRILMIVTVIAIVIWADGNSNIIEQHMLEIFLIMTREIISAPFAIYAYFSKIGIPHARFIGKLTTALQGIAFPLILIDLFYKPFAFAIYFVWITAIAGIFSASMYVYDVYLLKKKSK